MKHALSLLAVSLLLAACGGNEEATDTKKADEVKADAAATTTAAAAPVAKKYNIKSGILELKVDFIGPQTLVTYFDDFGAREATYTTTSVMGMTTTNVSIVADGYRIEYDPEAKTGKKIAGVTVNPSAVPNLAELTDELRREYDVKELGTKTFLGKEAKGISMNAMGMKMVVYHWENLPLYSEIYMGEKPMVMEAVKLETDVAIPAEKFQVPAGIALTEIDASGKQVSAQ